MIRLLILGILIFSAGCTAAPAVTESPTSTPAGALSTPVTPPIRTPSPTAVPTRAAETRIIVRQTTPQSAVVVPPAAPTQSTASSPRTGWRTFIHPDLHLAVDYPPDWTVRVQNKTATFTSPQGLAIQLAPVDPGALAPSGEAIQPNTRCSDAVNPHGIPIVTCRATIGFSLSTYLDLKPSEAAVISTGSPGASEVFNGLIDSARIVP